MNLFITGTDTDVGKTIVSSWICANTKAKYWKPIQTGDDSDSNTVKKFSPHTQIIPEAYKLKAPLSPYNASTMEGIGISPEELICRYDNVVIEGAGGALVPICKEVYMADLITKNHAKAIVVAKSKLGMINHILMTIESIRNRDGEVLGVIINGDVQSDIVKAVELFGAINVIAILPIFDTVQNALRNTPLPNAIKEIIS